MGEHGGERLADRGSQLDGPGAQPQPFGTVLWCPQRGDPGPDGLELGGGVLGACRRGHRRHRVGVGGAQLAELRERAGALGEQLSPPRAGTPGIGQSPVTQPDQRRGDRRVPDAADHERRLGDEVQPPAWFGGIGGGDRVPKARGELPCPVLRGGQRDQQLGALGAAGASSLGRGQRSRQVVGGVLEASAVVAAAAAAEAQSAARRSAARSGAARSRCAATSPPRSGAWRASGSSAAAARACKAVRCCSPRLA